MVSRLSPTTAAPSADQRGTIVSPAGHCPGLSHFQPIFYDTRSLLPTNHASLTWLLNFKEPEGQLAQWLETLQNYNFEIYH